MLEDTICIDFVSVLNSYIQIKKPNFVYFHVPNEISSNKNPIFGAKLKKMGKTNGVADYIFLWENGSGCIEFKAGKNGLTESQKTFSENCSKFKIPYEVARSVDEGINILKKWRLVDASF